MHLASSLHFLGATKELQRREGTSAVLGFEEWEGTRNESSLNVQGEKRSKGNISTTL